MSHYLDTSVMVALLLPDAHSSRADAWLVRERPTFLASDFCAVEFAAVVSRRVRMNQLTAETANLVLTLVDGGATAALCSANPLSTQDDVAAALVYEHGIEVHALRGEDGDSYVRHVRAVLDGRPNARPTRPSTAVRWAMT